LAALVVALVVLAASIWQAPGRPLLATPLTAATLLLGSAWLLDGVSTHDLGDGIALDGRAGCQGSDAVVFSLAIPILIPPSAIGMLNTIKRRWGATACLLCIDHHCHSGEPCSLVRSPVSAHGAGPGG
jgi:hypothetical protein